MTRIAGKIVKAPKPDTTMQSTTSKPKCCKGTMSENSNTIKPPETEKTLIKIARPLTKIMSSTAACAFFT